MASTLLGAYAPSKSTTILLSFLAVLLAALSALISNSSITTTEELPEGSGDEAPLVDMEAAVAHMAANWEQSRSRWRIMGPRELSAWASQRAVESGFHGWSFAAGLLLLPAGRVLLALGGRLCGGQAAPAARPRLSSVMDSMYCVDQPARVLLNVQLGETWMNFGSVHSPRSPCPALAVSASLPSAAAGPSARWLKGGRARPQVLGPPVDGLRAGQDQQRPSAHPYLVPRRLPCPREARR